MKINRAVCRNLRVRIDNALKKEFVNSGLTPKTGSASFTESNVTFKLSLSCEVDGKSHAKIEWDKYCKMYDLKPEDFGKRLKGDLRICGLKPRASKYPIVAERTDGKRFKLSEFDLKLRMED